MTTSPIEACAKPFDALWPRFAYVLTVRSVRGGLVVPQPYSFSSSRRSISATTLVRGSQTSSPNSLQN